MEVVPIRNSLVNGEKAYHYGEWDGSISSRWNSSKMIFSKPFEKIDNNKISNKNILNKIKTNKQSQESQSVTALLF